MNDIELKKVIAVVVTYNRKVLLRECLLALKSQAYRNLQVLIIDNDSNDGTQDYVADLIDNQKFIYFNTGKNLGGAGGFNYGIKQAMQIGCDYVWLMDDDCIVQESSLLTLLDFAKQKDENFGFVSSVVKWIDGTLCKMNIQRVGIGQKVDDFNINQKIKIATFVSLLVKTSVIEDVGLPIKDFFIWGDDWEYTYRISKKYNSYLVSNSVVIHKCKENIGSDISKDSAERLGRYFYAYRNEGYFYRKNGLWFRFWMKRMLHIKRILFSRCSDKFKRLKVLHQGAKAARKFNPQIEYDFGKNKRLEVLEFFAEPLSYGGQEAFMVNMYKNFRCNYHYTFITPFFCDNQVLINLAKEKNDTIISRNYNFYSRFRKKYIKQVAIELLKKNHYDIVHIQSGSIYALCIIAKLAKKYGIKKIIVHSHSTGKLNIKYRLIKYYSDKQICKCANVFLACSDLAAKWKFPKNIIENKLYQVVKNGIPLKNFSFNMKIRKQYRESFNLTDEFVLCNVGRFEYQKNHDFLIEVARLLSEKHFHYKFILVGDGPLKSEIIKKIDEYGLQEKFIFLEKRNDISQIMMASDAFVMPSRFEGLPVTLIEAQATGLKVFASETITTEVGITDLIKFVPITDPNVWAEEIMNYNQHIEREQYAEIVAKAGYSAEASAKLLENIYLGNQ